MFRRVEVVVLMFVMTLASGRANATATTNIQLDYFLYGQFCNPIGSCSATLSGDLIISATAIATPGMNVDVKDSGSISLIADNTAGTGTAGVDLREKYSNWYIEVTNGLYDSGEWAYQGISGGSFCAYPDSTSRRPGFGFYCDVDDFTDYLFLVPAGEVATFNFTASVEAQAASVPEPSTMGMTSIVLSLLVQGFRIRRAWAKNLAERALKVALVGAGTRYLLALWSYLGRTSTRGLLLMVVSLP